MMDSITIRPLTLADEPFLWDMLYQALYVPAGQPPFPRDIMHEPDISRYAQGWGRADDQGFVALDEGKPVGAVWLRLLTRDQRGFGYVDETTPELSIALLPEYRGQGIGSKLIIHLLDQIQSRYDAVCLSVSPDNPAKRLYERLGFDVVGKNGTALTLVKRWGK
ncbi:MAG TPA: GNAT family N-acetyltransferase [Anaerolineae bacterium]|jgi:ribosomal protein S18 acetylase RimI-like enzyme